MNNAYLFCCCQCRDHMLSWHLAAGYCCCVLLYYHRCRVFAANQQQPPAPSITSIIVIAIAITGHRAISVRRPRPQSITRIIVVIIPLATHTLGWCLGAVVDQSFVDGHHRLLIWYYSYLFWWNIQRGSSSTSQGALSTSKSPYGLA